MKGNWLTNILLIIIAILLFFNILTGLTARFEVIKLSEESICELDRLTGEVVFIKAPRHPPAYQPPSILGRMRAFSPFKY